MFGAGWPRICTPLMPCQAQGGLQGSSSRCVSAMDPVKLNLEAHKNSIEHHNNAVDVRNPPVEVGS